MSEGYRSLEWQYNEWQGDGKYDDKTQALIEALREIAEQLHLIDYTLNSRS